MQVIELDEIKKRLDIATAVAMQEEGFRLYSAGKVRVPPVGYLNMGTSYGEVHIKYGWIPDDPLFVVKIAGAYSEGVHGMMMALDSKTGRPRYFLKDEGYLTNIRTAMAGLIAAKYLAPQNIRGIGIVGTGMQARLQAQLLKAHTSCRDLQVWGRDKSKAEAYAADMEKEGFDVHIAQTTAELCRNCQLIVTTTAARGPLIRVEDIQPGTHITAVGADAPGKQELDPEIFLRTDRVAVDSKSQCIDHGDLANAPEGVKGIVELGEIIADPQLGRGSEHEITIADLTGVGVQDIQIAKAVLD